MRDNQLSMNELLKSVDEIIDANQARREYMRKWRADHPDKIRRYQQKYWITKGRKRAAEREAEKARTKAKAQTAD